MIENIASLREAVAAEHAVLGGHSVFSAIRKMQDLRLFMQWHVFAVWDFMSLLKRLQNDLTSVSVPWVPPAHPKAARLINEIVLGEESDDGMAGTHLSHYGLYLNAMRDVGASTARIEEFVSLLASGVDVETAFSRADVAPPIADFVRSTLRTAQHGKLHEVLGSFFYGRENVIPSMFRTLLERWRIVPKDAPAFVYYLERHIALDSGKHGPATESIIAEIVGSDGRRLEELLTCALNAVRARHRFWDRLRDELVA